MGNRGDISILKLWTSQTLDSKNSSQKTFLYFTREMKTGTACIKSYSAHVFIQAYQTQSEMEHDWRNVNYHIAMYYQSRIKNIIEKSNFYICFFVPEKISNKIRNEIEGNSFCAKKYILYDCYNTWLENLLEIENKIFSLNLPVAGNVFPKLRKMKLQNFRAYAGSVTIDFGDPRKEAASFVAVYAKNGVGKTSLFDGVEYALKGEVERIMSLIEKDKNVRHKGPIYHNRDNAESDAYVSMELENGRTILRMVSKIPEGGNDLRTLTAKEGREITGTKKDKDVWKQTILPHDKIDSFISAKSPVEQYKEWIAAAAPLQSETDEFEKAYQKYRKSEIVLNDIQNECTEISKRLEEISKVRVAVDKIIALINSYNKMAEEDKKLFLLEEDADVQQYDCIVNLATKYGREMNIQKIDLEKNIFLAEDILASGVETYQEMLASVHETEQALKKFNLQIKRKKELDVLLQMNISHMKVLDECKKELEMLQGIVTYGVERVQENCRRYCQLEKMIDDRKISRTVLEKNHQEVSDVGRKAELKNRELEGAFLTKEDYEEVHKKAEELDETKAEIRKIQIKWNVVQQQWLQYRQSIESISKILDEIRPLILPAEISDLTIVHITKSDSFLKNEEQSQFFDLIEKHKNCEIQLKLFQEELLKSDQNHQKLKEIRQIGIEYVNAHKNISNCPLCHSVFDDWKSLILSISDVHEEKNELLEEKIKQNEKDVNLISKKYKVLYHTYNESKETYIKDLQSKLSAAEKECADCTNQKRDYERQKESAERKFMELKAWFTQKNIKLKDISLAEVEIWRKKQEEDLKLSKIGLEEILKQKENIQAKITEVQKDIQNFMIQKEEIEGDIDLYRYIEFLRKQPEDFDIKIRLDERNIQLQKYENEQKERQIQIDQYKDVSDIELETMTKARDIQIKSLEKASEIKEKYKIFDDLSEDRIKDSLKNWVNMKKMFEFIA